MIFDPLYFILLAPDSLMAIRAQWRKQSPFRAGGEPEKWFETPETAKQVFTHASGVTVRCSLGKGGFPGGVTFEGLKGTIYVRRGAITATLNGAKVADPSRFPTGDTKMSVSNNHQGAGCDSNELLTHLRGDGPHLKGCWALDLVLGKE